MIYEHYDFMYNLTKENPAAGNNTSLLNADTNY